MRGVFGPRSERGAKSSVLSAVHSSPVALHTMLASVGLRSSTFAGQGLCRPVAIAAPARHTTVSIEAAHKKGAGSTKNGRDSESKRRGVKVYGGQPVKAGGIIFRQTGSTVSGELEGSVRGAGVLRRAGVVLRIVWTSSNGPIAPQAQLSEQQRNSSSSGSSARTATPLLRCWLCQQSLTAVWALKRPIECVVGLQSLVACTQLHKHATGSRH